MECFYVSDAYDERIYKKYICHIGEQAGICSDEMIHVEINGDVFAQNIYDILVSEAPVILNLSEPTADVLMFLYGRFIRHPHKTFLLLSQEALLDLDWGFGTGKYEWTGNEKADQKLLIGIKRDFAFFMQEGESFELEPVLSYLKKYWDNGRFWTKENFGEGMNFLWIDEKEENTGEAITKRLKHCVAEENENQFKEELKNIDSNENIDPIDYIIISRICEEMKLPIYRVSVLEQGINRWGENYNELYFELVDAYIDSPNLDYRKKGLALAEQYFMISYDEKGLPVFIKERMHFPVKIDYIKSLFNAYISLDDYRSLEALYVYETEFCRDTDVPGMHNLFIRNKAICFRQSGEYQQALKLFCKLFIQEENGNTLNLIICTLKSLKQYQEAVEILCNLCWMSQGNEKTIIDIAQIMSENAIVYEKGIEWHSTGGIGNEHKKQVIPLLFFIFSFEDNQRKRSLLYDIDKVLETLQEDNIRDFLRRHRLDLSRIWGEFMQAYREKYDFSVVGYLENGYSQVANGEWDGRQNIINCIMNMYHKFE